MASGSDDTTKCFHDRSFRRFLLQNLYEEKACQNRRAKWSFQEYVIRKIEKSIKVVS